MFAGKHNLYRMTKLWGLACLLLLLLSPLSLLAQEDKVVVAIPVNTSDFKAVMPLIEQWSAETGITVEIIEENTSTYLSSYVLAGRTGSPRIDVIMFWDFYIDQLYPMLIPLDGSFDPDIAISEEDRADFLDNALARYQGHDYMLPFSLDLRLFYYRTDLLEAAGFTEPPATWAELVEYAQALTKDLDGDGSIDQWGFASLGLPGQVFNTYTFFDFLFQNGGQIMDEDGLPAFNSPEGVEALQFMVDLRNTYKVMPEDVITYDNNEIHEGFVAGRFAMVNHWPYLMGMVNSSDLAGKVAYTMEPPPADGTSLTTFNRWSFGIPQIAENKAGAWGLIQFLTGTEAGIYEYSQMLDWPVRRSVYEAPEVTDLIPEAHRQFSEFVFSIAETSAIPVMLPRAGETSQILADHIDRAMVGQMTPQEALDAAAAAITQLLQG